jgi:surface protein
MENSAFKPLSKEILQYKLLDIADNGPIPQSWDLRNVKDFSILFEDFSDTVFDERFSFISDWDVEHVLNMAGMFMGCTHFNIPLNKWNVSNVKTMESMFHGCSQFNQPLNHWNVSNVKNMESMFHGCTQFNQPLNHWNVSNVKTMESMFNGCTQFNENIDFNYELNTWNVSSVTNMESMFQGCSQFNKPLNNWIVFSVTNMEYMFKGCSQFNKPLNHWNVSNVKDMKYMFSDCTQFNKPLTNWVINHDASITNMFRNCAISKENRPTRPQSKPIQITVNGYKIKRKANLNEALLQEANLNDVNLNGASLIKAKLSKSMLRSADLRNADLYKADLRDADLRGAFLDNAILSYSNLEGANLTGATLTGAKVDHTILDLNYTGVFESPYESSNESSGEEDDYEMDILVNYLESLDIEINDNQIDFMNKNRDNTPLILYRLPNPIANIPTVIQQQGDFYINRLGIDIIAGDGDIPQTRIGSFLKRNRNSSIVINHISENNDGTRESTIYLLNKIDFLRLIIDSIVYPCLKASGRLTDANQYIPLCNLQKIIGRRLNIQTNDVFLNLILPEYRKKNIFVNLVKTQITFPSIASKNVLDNAELGTPGYAISRLKCMPGPEPEELWLWRQATVRVNTKNDINWHIYRIDYIYPSVREDIYELLSSPEYGINIESIFLNNADEVIQIQFENNSVELSFGKTRDDTFRNIKWEDSPTDDLTQLNIVVNHLEANPLDILFSGMENDEDGNYTTKKNLNWIKDGIYGRYVKLHNISDPNLDSANINDDIRFQIIEKSIDIIQTILYRTVSGGVVQKHPLQKKPKHTKTNIRSKKKLKTRKANQTFKS